MTQVVGVKKWASDHKKELIVGGVVTAAAIGLGVAFVNGQRNSYIKNITSTAESNFSKNMLKADKKDPFIAARHESASRDMINKLSGMKISELRKESNRVNLLKKYTGYGERSSYMDLLDRAGVSASYRQ